jgi:hypothetical protein
MGVFDDYLVDPKLSLLDKTRIQAQVLVPVLRALRAELGREKADAIAKEALRGWSKELFAAIGWDCRAITRSGLVRRKRAEPPPQAFASEQGNARHGEGGRDNAQKNAATEERQPRKTTLEGKIMPDDVCHGAPLQLTRQLYLQRA